MNNVSNINEILFDQFQETVNLCTNYLTEIHSINKVEDIKPAKVNIIIYIKIKIDKCAEITNMCNNYDHD